MPVTLTMMVKTVIQNSVVFQPDLNISLASSSEIRTPYLEKVRRRSQRRSQSNTQRLLSFPAKNHAPKRRAVVELSPGEGRLRDRAARSPTTQALTRARKRRRAVRPRWRIAGAAPGGVRR